ncbi:MAG TPA: zf-HC2 domain-containing protein [Bryobacteraceae bacterium]|nr:zf-HC2 domain-containing protein [Bryobacteraceae bacterium]
MNCEKTCELIALAASGDVTAAERTAIDRHLANCAICREEAAAFAALTGELAAMRDESAGEGVFSAVRACVLKEISGSRRPICLKAWPAFAAAIACTAILVVLLRPVPTPPQPLPEVREAEPSVSLPAVPETAPARAAKPHVTPIHKQSEPLVIQMLTDDPNVIIYWIADARGGRAGKESNP